MTKDCNYFLPPPQGSSMRVVSAISSPQRIFIAMSLHSEGDAVIRPIDKSQINHLFILGDYAVAGATTPPIIVCRDNL